MSSYVVNWQQADGHPGWHPAGTVQEATAHVEHLRNHDGVDGARIYRLEEVAFEFKPYFRVELASAPAVPSTSFAASIAVEPQRMAEPELAPVDEVVAAPSWSSVIEGDAAATEPEALNGNGRRGLFGR